MPEITDAGAATEIARAHVIKVLKQRWGGMPRKGERQGDTWIISLDVGVLTPKMVEIRVDAKTGKARRHDVS